ncbi:hypothetical protein R1sor_001246 [Riccia sorocarpa]|uniref:Uncharacterized protein n=1 Tax=Riccia sorocarpa TaxID=122646 RepID=A0ABD3H1F2_9MARC
MYAMTMLAACVGLQPGASSSEVLVQEEEKFLKHVEEYRSKFWDKPLSMFTNDDKCCRKWDEIMEWERSNCPFYVDFTENPHAMFNQWEELCYQRRVEAARTQLALEKAQSQPDLLPELQEAHRQSLEKLPEVFDPRRLQVMTEDLALEQAKIFEPQVNQVIQVFSKLKRKKVQPEDKTPPTATPEPTKDVPDDQTEQTTGAPRSNRKSQKRQKIEKAAGNVAEEAAQISKPDLTVTVAVPTAIPAVQNPTPATADPVQVKDDTSEEQIESQDNRNSKRLKKKIEAKDLANGEFRLDLQFNMDSKWVAVKASLITVINGLKQKRQLGRSRTSIPVIDEVAGMCVRLKNVGRRKQQFVVNGARMEQGADLIILDIPTGRSIFPDRDIPVWNRFPESENYPHLLLNLAHRILDDNGYVLIFHSGSLESS